jgi:hypothetical protein
MRLHNKEIKMYKKVYGASDAVRSLCPNAQYIMIDNDYDQIEWLSEEIEMPSKSMIDDEVNRLQIEHDATEYQRLRKNEYPDFTDYLDGVVKGNQDQIDAYIAACLAVKEKYPKPN